MRISAHLATILAAVFALVCLGFVVTGFTSLDGIADPVQLRDAKGFVGFWAFLAAVGVVFGVVSWWLGHTAPKDE
ncbi:MAG: hypothetical protein H7X76_03560 [Prolixibacteraceae bacterium]|nr:hypothetical protein [Burkholderiales bacterium]